jgi:hypothetical protein
MAGVWESAGFWADTFSSQGAENGSLAAAIILIVSLGCILTLVFFLCACCCCCGGVPCWCLRKTLDALFCCCLWRWICFSWCGCCGSQKERLRKPGGRPPLARDSDEEDEDDAAS